MHGIFLSEDGHEPVPVWALHLPVIPHMSLLSYDWIVPYFRTLGSSKLSSARVWVRVSQGFGRLHARASQLGIFGAFCGRGALHLYM